MILETIPRVAPEDQTLVCTIELWSIEVNRRVDEDVNPKDRIDSVIRTLSHTVTT